MFKETALKIIFIISKNNQTFFRPSVICPESDFTKSNNKTRRVDLQNIFLFNIQLIQFNPSTRLSNKKDKGSQAIISGHNCIAAPPRSIESSKKRLSPLAGAQGASGNKKAKQAKIKKQSERNFIPRNGGSNA